MLGNGISMFDDICTKDKRPTYVDGIEHLISCTDCDIVHNDYQPILSTLEIVNISCRLDQLNTESEYLKGKTAYILSTFGAQYIYGKEDAAENQSDQTTTNESVGIFAKLWEAIKNLANKIWNFIKNIASKVSNWLFGSKNEIKKQVEQAVEVQNAIESNPKNVMNQIEATFVEKELSEEMSKNEDLKENVTELKVPLNEIASPEGEKQFEEALQNANNTSTANNKQEQPSTPQQNAPADGKQAAQDPNAKPKEDPNAKQEEQKLTFFNRVKQWFDNTFKMKALNILKHLKFCRKKAKEKMHRVVFKVPSFELYQAYSKQLMESIDSFNNCEKIFKSIENSIGFKSNIAKTGIHEQDIAKLETAVAEFEKQFAESNSLSEENFNANADEYTLEDIINKKSLKAYINYINNNTDKFDVLYDRIEKFTKNSEDLVKTLKTITENTSSNEFFTKHKYLSNKEKARLVKVLNTLLRNITGKESYLIKKLNRYIHLTSYITKIGSLKKFNVKADENKKLHIVRR